MIKKVLKLITIYFYVLVTLGLSLVLPFQCFGQPSINNYSLISISGGLSDREVYSLAEDDAGFLWLGTSGGLQRFDGYEFKNFTSEGDREEALWSRKIRRITKVNGGQLLIQYQNTDLIFSIIDPNDFEINHFDLGEYPEFGQFKYLSAEEGEDIYLSFTTKNTLSLYMFKDLEFKLIGENQLGYDLSQEAVPIVKLKAINGFGTSVGTYGVILFDSLFQTMLEIPTDSASQLVFEKITRYDPRQIKNLINGKVIFTMEQLNGCFIWRLEDKTFRPFHQVLENKYVKRIWEDGKGNLIFGIGKETSSVYEEAFFYENETDSLFPFPSLIDVETKIQDIRSEDFTKSAYVGTGVGLFVLNMDRGGIERILAKPLREGQWGKSFRGISGDDQGRIFMAREVKRWYIYHEENGRIDTIFIKKENGEIWDLFCSSNLHFEHSNILWGSSCDGEFNAFLHKYDLIQKQSKSFPFHKYLQSFVFDQSRNGIWAVYGGSRLHDGGLAFFDIKEEKYTNIFPNENENPLLRSGPKIISWSIDSTLFIGTSEGMFHFDPDSRKLNKIGNKSNQNINQLSSQEVSSIYQDKSGLIWVGTYGGGLILLNPNGELEAFNTSDGLANNKISGILPVDDHGLLIATYHGLSYFDINERLFGNYYEEDGLSYNEFNRLSYYYNPESKYFYFGGLNGVNKFRYEDLPDKEHLYQANLSKLTIYNRKDGFKIREKNLADLVELVLEPKDLYFRMDLSLPSYEKPEKNQFAFKIDEQDQNWNFIGNSHFIRVDKPKPGKYTFLIRGADKNGNWSETRSIDIIVKKVWYRKIGFIVIFIVTLIGLAYLIVALRIHALKKKQEESILINKRMAELEMQALQAQMNPHFIFNALAAIQYYLTTDRIETADNYLGRFAKLMRMFLESSKNKYVTIQEEYKLLKGYIDLEQLRFENKFEYQIHIDPEIDIYNYSIPGMILQPFIENAINHGLFHKDGKGRLYISMKKKGKSIECIIEDNGIGRQKANEIRQNSLRKHRSRGMQIVEERIEVLKTSDGLDIEINIEDLKDQKHIDCGTRIVTNIPFREL